MKSYKKIARPCLGIFICILILASLNTNGQVIKRSVEELTHNSKTILYGKCTQVESTWDENHERIYTEIKVQADGYLKGNDGSEVTITIPGGRVGNVIYEVSDMPAFLEGEEFVAFLTEHSTGRNLVTGAAQGKLMIHRDSQTGLQTIRRPVPAPSTQKKSLEIYEASAQKTEAISLEDFISEIRAYLEQ